MWRCGDAEALIFWPLSVWRREKMFLFLFDTMKMKMLLSEDVWDEIVPFFDLGSLDIFLRLNKTVYPRRNIHFRETLTRELETMRNFLEVQTAPNKGVLLFMVGLYLYNPRVVKNLDVDPYLDRFIRFFDDIPMLLVVETDWSDWAGPRLLRRFIKEYDLGIM